jgi:hypothetical protein
VTRNPSRLTYLSPPCRCRSCPLTQGDGPARRAAAGLLSLAARSGCPGLAVQPLPELMPWGKRSLVVQRPWLLEFMPRGRRSMAVRQAGGAVAPPPPVWLGSWLDDGGGLLGSLPSWRLMYQSYVVNFGIILSYIHLFDYGQS